MKTGKTVAVVPSSSKEEGPRIVKNVPGNSFDKHGSKNPIVVSLMRRFHQGVTRSIASFTPNSILDVGCGEGRTTLVVQDVIDARIMGVDLEAIVLREAQANVPSVPFMAASVYDLPFPNRSFDVVVATEVLEHLTNPDLAIREILRVARRGVVVSVPHEPWWRVANVVRGRYLADWGNTPGHVQHWSLSSFREILESVHGGTATISPVGLWLLGSVAI